MNGFFDRLKANEGVGCIASIVGVIAFIVLLGVARDFLVGGFRAIGLYGFFLGFDTATWAFLLVIALAIGWISSDSYRKEIRDLEHAKDPQDDPQYVANRVTELRRSMYKRFAVAFLIAAVALPLIASAVGERQRLCESGDTDYCVTGP